jgi:hypothetical protein
MPGAALGLNVGLRMAKEGFFRPEAILRAVDAAKRREMGHFGGYVRKVAKHSMKHRRGYSDPGTPPSRHVGLISTLLFYSYDAASDSVVIGPVLSGGKREGATTVPELMEHGGRVRRKVTRGLLGALYSARHSTPRTAGMFKALRPKLGQRVTMRYPARPFMGPAFQAATDRLEPFWKDSVRA